jgi:hypothetical protein
MHCERAFGHQGSKKKQQAAYESGYAVNQQSTGEASTHANNRTEAAFPAIATITAPPAAAIPVPANARC